MDVVRQRDSNSIAFADPERSERRRGALHLGIQLGEGITTRAAHERGMFWLREQRRVEDRRDRLRPPSRDLPALQRLDQAEALEGPAHDGISVLRNRVDAQHRTRRDALRMPHRLCCARE
jgi:hypothetical protein